MNLSQDVLRISFKTKDQLRIDKKKGQKSWFGNLRPQREKELNAEGCSWEKEGDLLALWQ